MFIENLKFMERQLMKDCEGGERFLNEISAAALLFDIEYYDLIYDVYMIKYHYRVKDV